MALRCTSLKEASTSTTFEIDKEDIRARFRCYGWKEEEEGGEGADRFRRQRHRLQWYDRIGRKGK